MSDTDLVVINTDGAARGNPGPAAFGFVIRAGGQVVRDKGCLGTMTNNQAEYTGLVRALRRALELGGDRRLLVRSDSELMIKQMRGEYRVKDEGLRPLYEEAQQLRRRFSGVTFEHVRRSENGEADRLCNEALDGERKVARADAPAGKKPRKARGAHGGEAVREQAVDCLRSAAAAWARGNPEDPPPEMVWEQLCSLLDEHS